MGKDSGGGEQMRTKYNEVMTPPNPIWKEWEKKQTKYVSQYKAMNPQSYLGETDFRMGYLFKTSKVP